MWFRFRRSFSIIPGLKLNLGKKGASFSVGPKGAKITIGQTGLRATAGIPGTGLSVTEHVPLAAAHHHDLAQPSQIAKDPPNLAALELLQTTLRSRLVEINAQWRTATIEGMDDASFTHLVADKSHELRGFLDVINKLLTADLLQAADAEALVRIVDQVAATMDGVIRWEAEVRDLAHVPRFRNVAETMSGISKGYLDTLNDLQSRLDAGIVQFRETHQIDLTLKWFPGGGPKADDFIAALAQFEKEAIARAAAA